MSTTRNIAVLAAVMTIVGLAACEESSSSSGGGVELADEPQSLLGKSAGNARDLANQAANRDGQASALADRLAGSGTVSALGLVFAIPEGWDSVAPSNNMRTAELHAGGCIAAISIAGGGIDDNIDRWSEQVLDAAGEPAEADAEDRTINGIDLTLVELSGTYMDGGMFGPKTERPDYSMFGAIIPQGQRSVFIKMTGPTDEMDDLHSEWIALIESVGRE